MCVFDWVNSEAVYSVKLLHFVVESIQHVEWIQRRQGGPTTQWTPFVDWATEEGDRKTAANHRSTTTRSGCDSSGEQKTAANHRSTTTTSGCDSSGEHLPSWRKHGSEEAKASRRQQRHSQSMSVALCVGFCQSPALLVLLSTQSAQKSRQNEGFRCFCGRPKPKKHLKDRCRHFGFKL